MGEPSCRLNIKSRLIKAPFYTFRAQTGLITAIAAATGSAGHLIALRNVGAASSPKELHVMQMRIGWLSNTDPSSAQRVGFLINKLTGFTALHTGGTGASTPSLIPRAEESDQYDDLQPEVVSRVAGTDALTAGTHTIGADLGRVHDMALVAAATVKKTRFEKVWKSVDGHPLFILAKNEGVLVRNAVLMANSLDGYLDFEFDCWARAVGVAAS